MSSGADEGFVEGHDFSRADGALQALSFSPRGLRRNHSNEISKDACCFGRLFCLR